MTRPYDDYGGQRQWPASYDGAIERDCTGCGSKAWSVCTFQAEVLRDGRLQVVSKPRHAPCVVRTKSVEA